MDFSEFQINKLGHLFATPAGIIAVALFVILLMATGVLSAARWWALTVLIFASSLGVNATTFESNRLFSPLAEMQEFTRPICAAMLLALLFPTIRSVRGWRWQPVLGGTKLLFAFELVLAARILAAGNFSRGYFGVIIFLLIFLTMGVGLGRWLQSMKDVHTALWCVVITGALVAGCTVIQYLFNPLGVVWQGRLYGTTANPNFMGTLLATTLIPTLYFAARRGARLWARVACIGVAALSIVMILWTGSRTGGAMALTGIILLFRRHVGRFLLVGAVCTVFALMAWQFFSPDQAATADRIFSGGDTRTTVWAGMLRQFLTSPVIGVTAGSDNSGSESSYLLAARSTGLLGLIPFGVALLTINSTLMYLWRARHQLGPYRDLADLIVASLVALQVGGIFEGYFCSTFSIPLLACYVYLAVLAFLKDYVTAVTPVQDSSEGDSLVEDLYADASLQPSAAMGNYP